MAEMGSSQKPPQISDMFQKFALSFKSKAFEFFSDESEKYPDQEQEQEQAIPEKGNKRSSNSQFNQTLITSLFATISSFEASYLHLQTAHVPNFDQNAIQNADRALVSHLQTLSEFKQLYRNYYRNPNFNIEFSTGSCLEFQANENQHKLRALKSVFNRLQSEIDVKDEQVSGLRLKLRELERVNLGFLKELSFWGSDDILISVRVFDKMLRDAFGLCHKFTKVLIFLMRNSGWDLDLAANCVYSDVEYAKKGHNKYALLSYVCLRMFQGFDSDGFGLVHDDSVSNNDQSSISRGKIFGQGFDLDDFGLVHDDRVCSNDQSSISRGKILGQGLDSDGFGLVHDDSVCNNDQSSISKGKILGQGFDSDDFGVVHDDSVSNNDNKPSISKATILGQSEPVSLNLGLDSRTSNGEKMSHLKHLKDHMSTNPIEILRKSPTCEFSRFCEMKYQQLIHPTMDSSLSNIGLDKKNPAVNSWKSLGVFYELFVKMASSVWALHRLAFSFGPHVDIFQVERGVDFSMVYMEDVTKRCNFPTKNRPKVGFTVVPGFKIGRTIVQSRVYLT